VIAVLLILIKYVLPLLREARVRNYTKNTARLMLPKIVFLTESLLFGTVFLRVVSAPSLNSFKHNIKSVDFSIFSTVSPRRGDSLDRFP